MGTYCAPFIADLSFISLKRNFMASLSDINKLKLLLQFNLTSRYLDKVLIFRILTLEAWCIDFFHLSNSLMLLMCLILKSSLWIYIHLFQTDLFHPTFNKSAMILIH